MNPNGVAVEGLPTTAIVSTVQNCNKSCAENHHDQAMRLSSTAGRPPGQATSWCQATAAHAQSSAATTPTTTHGTTTALRDPYEYHVLLKDTGGGRTQEGPPASQTARVATQAQSTPSANTHTAEPSTEDHGRPQGRHRRPTQPRPERVWPGPGRPRRRPRRSAPACARSSMRYASERRVARR